MQCRKLQGFSLMEMLISISIVALLALTSVFLLKSSQENDELNTAARQLAGDIRSMQSRALASQNVKTCTNASSETQLCEDSIAGCAGACTAANSYGFGIHIYSASSTYVAYADITPAAPDYKYTKNTEKLFSRTLAILGSATVYVKSITSTDSLGVQTTQTGADIDFTRQTGKMRLVGLGGSEPVLLIILLEHKTSKRQVTVEINRVTGRVSIL